MSRRTRQVQNMQVQYWILRDGDKIPGVHHDSETANMFAAIAAVEEPDSVFAVVKVDRDYRCPEGTTMHVRTYAGY